MKRYVIAILVVVSALVAMTSTLGCEPSPATGPDGIGVGPNLLSEDETVALVLQETPLVEVTDIGLQKCSPIYRVVRGKAEDDRDLVVWVSDEIVGHVHLDEMTSEQEAIFKTKEAFRGCTVYEAVPVFIPDFAKAHALGGIQESRVNTFWHIIYGYDKANESIKRSEFVPMVDTETALGGPIVAQADIAFLHTLYIVQVPVPGENGSPPSTDSDGSSDSGDPSSFSGFFDLVVRGNLGTELDRHSLNQHFGGGPLRFEGPVNLVVVIVSDSETRWPVERDVAIGFPASDGSGEYRYVVFAFRANGLICPLQATGYKEDGCIYTAPAGHSAELTTARGEGRRTVLVGVKNECDVFEPARYVWDGTKYEFYKDDPFYIPIWDGKDIHPEQITLRTHGREYSIGIEQTEYIKPPLPGEPHFSIYKSQYYGSFHLVVRDKNGYESSRLPLNEQFGDEVLGSGGDFSIVLQDYNGDGDQDFAIESPESGGFGPSNLRNVLFSINSQGVARRLPVTGYKEDGYLYRGDHRQKFRLLEDDEKGILITVYEDGTEEKYVWDGSKFVFSK